VISFICQLKSRSHVTRIYGYIKTDDILLQGRSNWQQTQQPRMPSNRGGANWQGMQQAPPSNFYHGNQQFQPPSGPVNQGQFQVHHQGQVPFQQPFQGQRQFQNSQVQNVPQGFGPGQNLGYQGSPQLQQHRPHPTQMSPQQLRQQQQRVRRVARWLVPSALSNVLMFAVRL